MTQPTTRTRSVAKTQTENNATPMPISADVSLSTNQQQALESIVQQLDGTAPRKTIELIGPRGSGKTTLLRELLQSKHVRHTSLHRRVIGVLVDAAHLTAGLAPWQHLIFAVLERLIDATQPTPAQVILDLHGELRTLIKIDPKNEQVLQLATAAFAHHFRTAWQGILLNTVAKANATFIVALDHVEESAPDLAMQMLEAAKYFLTAPGCTCILSADQDLLIDTLDRSAPGTDGEAIVNAWAVARVVLTPSQFGVVRSANKTTGKVTMHSSVVSSAAPVDKSAGRPVSVVMDAAVAAIPIKPDTAPAAVTASAASHLPKPTGKLDVPDAIYGLLHEWLQADGTKINAALTQWRTAMRAVMKRAQEGQRTGINSEHIAKVVALKNICPALFDAARFDASMLVGLERRAGHPKLAEVGNEFDKIVATDQRLKALLKAQPVFSSLETRDLATALRICNVDELVVESMLEPAPQLVATDSVNVRRTTARDIALPQISVRMAPLLATVATVTVGTFIVDRIPKLFIEAGKPILGGLLELTPVSRNIADVMNSGLAIGAELVGVALALLMLLFWGVSRAAGRGGMLYAVSFGLILGSMLANLLDRVVYGAVLNFIHVGSLPVFNLAHIGLLLGAMALAVSMLIYREPVR